MLPSQKSSINDIINQDEFTIGIIVATDEDSVFLQCHNVGNESKQLEFIQYLHKKLLKIHLAIPNCQIQCATTASPCEDVFVVFRNLGNYSNRLAFEKFLYAWLPNNLD